MIDLIPSAMTFNDHKIDLSFNKTYTLYRNGLYKTCNKGKAIELLSTGEWFDKTRYENNEEKLNVQAKCRLEEQRIGTWHYGDAQQVGGCGDSRFDERRSGDRASLCDREEPRHEQHFANLCNGNGKEHNDQTLRTGSECSEVTRKRGRPKKVNK